MDPKSNPIKSDQIGFKPDSNVTPDLKQIYEKIMSTPTKPQPINPTSASTASKQPIVIPSTPVSETPPLNNSSKPTQISSPPELTTPPPPSTPFLTSVPPRPLKNPQTAPYVFTSGQRGKVVIPAPATTVAAHNDHEGSGFSKVVIGSLVVVFLAAYTFFWLLIFGYVDKSTFGL